MSSRVAVLCVDDEPHVIGGLALHLRRHYEVTSAHSGPEGLDVLRRKGPFAVVLSDMRMPEMDGATFLAHARELAPDTIRMVLTGHANVAAAIAAVNEGHIFRFLTKPCHPDQLRLAFDAAAEQHRLITSERVLLEQTLHGSIKALVDVLSLTNPVSFGRAIRLKRYISALAERLGVRERWQVEVAAMLSQLGCVTLPAETAERVQHGEPLLPHEDQMVGRVPIVTEQLLSSIPRLEVVRGILTCFDSAATPAAIYGATADQQLVKLGAQMLRIVVDFDMLEVRGYPPTFAIDTMRGRHDRYEEEILEAFAATRGDSAQHDQVRELSVSAIRVGMILAEDARMSNGALLAARGYEITTSFVERARNYSQGTLREPLRVVVPSHLALV